MFQAVTHVGHLLSDVSNTVQTSKTVEGVNETGDEADDLVLPARIVDPSLEDKVGASVRRSAGNHSNQHHKPADLKVEEREPVQAGDNFVSKHDNSRRDEVEALVDNESLPGLDLKRLMIQSDEGHDNLRKDEVGRGGGKDPSKQVSTQGDQLKPQWLAPTAKDTEPSREEAQNPSSSPGSNSSNPVIHASFSGIRGNKLGQRCAEKALQHRHEDKAVDDRAGAPSTNLSDQAEAETRPRDGGRRCQANQTQRAEVSLKLLSVAW